MLAGNGLLLLPSATGILIPPAAAGTGNPLARKGFTDLLLPFRVAVGDSDFAGGGGDGFDLASEGTEVLELAKVPLDECLRRVDSGEIKDAMSIIALLRLNRRLKSL